MGERKILNKYIPADFDPTLVPKLSTTKEFKATQKKNEVRFLFRGCVCCVCGVGLAGAQRGAQHPARGIVAMLRRRYSVLNSPHRSPSPPPIPPRNPPLPPNRAKSKSA